MAIIDGVLADLAAEGDDLDRLVSGIGQDQCRWLSFAQAYAGPSGRGRAPGQFAPARQD